MPHERCEAFYIRYHLRPNDKRFLLVIDSQRAKASSKSTVFYGKTEDISLSVDS